MENDSIKQLVENSNEINGKTKKLSESYKNKPSKNIFNPEDINYIEIIIGDYRYTNEVRYKEPVKINDEEVYTKLASAINNNK